MQPIYSEPGVLQRTFSGAEYVEPETIFYKSMLNLSSTAPEEEKDQLEPVVKKVVTFKPCYNRTQGKREGRGNQVILLPY